MPWKLKPSPSFLIYDFIHSPDMNAVNFGYRISASTRIKLFSDFSYLSLSKFISIYFFTFCFSAMYSSIVSIFLRCSPFKILDSIIFFITIEMSCLLSFWFVSNKRFKNKTMNGKGILGLIFHQCNRIVSTVIPWFENMWFIKKFSETISIRVIRTNLSSITDFISFKIWYWFPYFFHFNSYKKLTGFESVSLSRRYGKTSEMIIIPELRYKLEPYCLDKLIIS